MLFGNKYSAAVAKMKALSEAYGASLPARLEELEVAATGLSAGGSFDGIRETLDDVSALAHKIAGTAGTFGYQAVTDHARDIETGLRQAIAAERPLTGEQAAGFASQIAVLKALGAKAPDVAINLPTSAARKSETSAQDGHVVLLAPPGDATEMLARQIEQRGYRVRSITDSTGTENSDGDMRARAVLVHTALPQGHKICRRLAEEIQRTSRTNLPIIFLSDTDEFTSRLQAVRAGAAAFLAAPLDAAAVVSKIEELSASPVFAPYRILIVEDDDMLALHCAGAFEGPGYSARVVKDPAELLDRLETFDTELIVMEQSFAGVSGFELAKVVWQHDAYRDIAVLFLSPGPEFNVQLLQAGLSDAFFIPRPVDVNALRRVVVRYLADARLGRRCSNFAELYHHLDRIAGLEAAGDGYRDGHGGNQGVSTAPDADPQGPPKVLVVDDDRHLVDAIAIKLSEVGIEPLKAFTGEQGFRVAWEESPDAIISDYEMPDGSGDYLLSRLKEAEQTRHIPVMVMTAHTMDGQKDYALEREIVGRLGAVSYLAKPISFDALLAEVGRLVRVPAGDLPQPGGPTR
jgi:DNA-binding response OmpR family regulator/HPt (histidine-containing phosphotransfer) domain-containing protein